MHRRQFLETAATSIAAVAVGGSLPCKASGEASIADNLPTIPYGAVRFYAEQAAHIGRPEAGRAIGKANGDNRLAIVVPCHRVVGKDGQLTGYGGGLWRKKRLLELEAGTLELC